MPLVKDGTVVRDPWTAVATAADLDDPGPVLLPLALWREHRGRLAGGTGGLGVRLAADESPALIADDLDRLDLVALEFPKFTDGRAYSHARLLRERHRFAGEIRAVGNVLRDQIAFMLRCGFDAFEGDARTVEAWRAGTAAFSAWYQPAADGAAPIPARRRRAAAARTDAPAVRSEPVRPARQPDPVELAVCAATWAY